MFFSPQFNENLMMGFELKIAEDLSILSTNGPSFNKIRNVIKWLNGLRRDSWMLVCGSSPVSSQ